jgi:colicin import membrane protein
MNAYVYPSQQEKVISGASAFGMHLVFVALLVFGVNWQKKVEPQANIVDLWTNLPSQGQPAPPPPPPPQPEVKPQVQPVEPPKAAVKPEVAKPDIAMKDKAEKERRALEEKQKEAKKHAEESQAAQKQQAAEAQRLAREQEDAQRRVAEQAGAAQAKLRAEYIERIRTKIKRFIVLPPNMQGNPRVEFTVVLLPSGEVLGIRTKSGSSNTAWDNAVERAIQRAQPMPMPPDPNLLREFRELELGFRPNE